MKISTFFIGIFLAVSAYAKKIEVDVAGMTCGMCIGAITKELEQTDKVENIKVSLDDKMATFSEIKDKKISDSEIRSVIKKAGYEAVKIRRK